MDYLVGIDIGGTTVKMGFVDLNGNIIKKWEILTRKEEKGRFILTDIASSLLARMEEDSIQSKEIYGIGFGVPGPVYKNEVLICANLGWEHLNVSEEFAKLIPFKTNIVVGNDANMAAYGEISQAGRPIKNAVMITLGTGVGGGVIIDGMPVDGIHGAGGEFGHTKIDFMHNFKCNCGNSGCLETVTSATGVVNIAKEYMKGAETKLNDIPNVSCKDVFDLALKGDVVCQRTVEEFGYYLGLATSLVACVIDPECFYIGGGVSKSGQQLIDVIEKYYKKFVFGPLKETKFYIAKLGNDSGMVGAAMLSKNV